MLTALDVFGFKSFADKTRFDFSKGVTAVVGPNGSGKSNVVDALKWIFGDQSAKSLRGKDMLDVIFNGAANRKASGYAEAVLTFDNSSGFLPLESAEVQIGRRLWRSGDSEYLINQEVSRLKDVRNLLMGTGVGAAAYCIIEQGRVDQILQANASTRRTVFEEAAGISRYKSRRTEALRKLDRVEQNLLRLTDIVDEVDSQLSGLRSQAAKASRHRDLSARLRETWIGLAADDFRILSQRNGVFDEQRSGIQSELDECTNQQRSLEQQLKELDDALGVVEESLREVECRQTEKRESLAASETTVRHQTTRLRELNADIKRLRRQARTMDGRSHESSKEREHLVSVLGQQTAELQRLQQDASSRQLQIEDASDRISSTRETLEETRALLMKKLKESSSLSGLVESTETRLQEQQTLITQLEAEIEKSAQSIDQQKCELEKTQDKTHNLAQQLRDAEHAMAQIQSDRQSLIGEQGEYQRSLADLRETRSAWEARKAVLEDLESRQEGLGVGVREILNRARSSDHAPWTEIRGSVADLLQVEMDQAALVEVALGGRAQLVVVKRLAPLVEYLQKESTRISGRVGFLAIDTGAVFTTEPSTSTVEKRHPECDLGGRAGVVCRADKLVTAAEENTILAQRLLADTWVVERLEDALHLYREVEGRCRFVTLQGEVVEQDGRLLVGSLHAETALMSRKSELRRLRNDLIRLDSRIEDEEFRLKKLAESMTTTDAQLSSAEQSVKQLAASYTQARTAEDLEQKELRRTEADHETRMSSFQEITQESEQTIERLGEYRDRTGKLQLEISQQENRLEQIEQKLVSDESQLASARDRATHCEAAEDQQRERIEATEESLERLDRELGQRQLEQNEAANRFEATLVKLSQTKLQVLNQRGTLAEEVIELDRMSEEAGTLLQQRKRHKGMRSQLLDEELSVRSAARAAEDRLHEIEMNHRDVLHQITTLESRITEEFGVSIAEACAAGASAFADYMRDRNPEAAVISGSKSASTDDQSPPDEQQSSEAETLAEDLRPGHEDASSGLIDAELPDVAESKFRQNVDSEVTETPAQSYEGYEEARPAIEAEIASLRRKLKHLGSVSSDSLANLDELELRFETLSIQLSDLQEARNALDEIIKRINIESRRMFLETFESIREHFQELFRKLFGGGEGDIILEDMDDVLECGIEIVARPPGKELRSLSLLSGGEKTMTAVALLLAIFRSRPSPFCVLDEVDAALDEANVGRFVSVLKEFQESTQFIMITHRKPSMASADVLYGVTMEESGVSKRMSVRFEDIGEDGDFAPPPKGDGRSHAA